MIVGFVLVLSVVWISIATALYSNFLPYFSLLSDIKNYNMAYYGANTAIERSLLVLRYQDAGFEWTGWRSPSGSVWPSSDSLSNNFWYYTSGTTLQRSIQSRGKDGQIPGTWNGTIDSYFLWSESNNYNMLSYRTPQEIPLWVDTTSSEQAYVSDSEYQPYQWWELQLQLQLPSSVKEKFSGWWGLWKLNDTDNDLDNDGSPNDTIVDRWWKGLYNNGLELSDFSILPRSVVAIASWSDTPSVGSTDESIREDIINTMTTSPDKLITFQWKINPLEEWFAKFSWPHHLIIGNDSISDSLQDEKFSDLLNNTNIKNQTLHLFLTKQLLSLSNNIYPFLEYRVLFNWDWSTIAQPYFTVSSKSKVGNYTVQMNLKKSINKDDTLWSFTVVF